MATPTISVNEDYPRRRDYSQMNEFLSSHAIPRVDVASFQRKTCECLDLFLVSKIDEAKIRQGCIGLSDLFNRNRKTIQTVLVELTRLLADYNRNKGYTRIPLCW